jgi:hypothetical protein
MERGLERREAGNQLQLKVSNDEPSLLFAVPQGQVAMTASKGVPWDLFKWIMAGAAAIIVSLIGYVVFHMDGDISELKSASRETTKAIEVMHVDITQELGGVKTDLVKSVGDVKEQIAISNGKIDTTNARLEGIATSLGVLAQQSPPPSSAHRR